MSNPLTDAGPLVNPLVNVPELDLERVDPNQALREVYQAYPSLADQRLPRLTNNIVNPALTSTVNTVANEYLPAGRGFNYDGPFGYADTRQKLLGTAPNISLGPEVTWSRAQPRDTGGGIQPFRSNVYFDAGGSAAGMDIEDIVAGIQDAIKNTNVAGGTGGTQIPEGFPEGTEKIEGGYGLPDGTAVPDAETQAEIDALIAQGNADLDAAGQGVDIGDIGGVQNVDVNAIDPAGTGGGGFDETRRAPGVEIVDNTGATSTTSTLQDWLGMRYTNNRVPRGAEGLQYNEATDNPANPTYMLKPSVLEKLRTSSEDVLKNVSKFFDITTGKQRSQYGPRPENESAFAQQLKRVKDLIKGRMDEGIKPFETRGTYTQLGDRTPYGIDVIGTLANLEEVIRNPENIQTQEYGDLQFKALVNWSILYSQFGSQIGLPFAAVSLGDDVVSAFGNLLGDNWEDRGNPVQDVVHYTIWKIGDIFKTSYNKTLGRTLGKIKPGSIKDKLGKLSHNFDFDFGPNKQPQPKIRITFNKKPQEAPEFKGTVGRDPNFFRRGQGQLPPKSNVDERDEFKGKPVTPSVPAGDPAETLTNIRNNDDPRDRLRDRDGRDIEGDPDVGDSDYVTPLPPRTTIAMGPAEGRGTFPKPPPQVVDAETLTTTPVEPTEPTNVTDKDSPKKLPTQGVRGIDWELFWLPYANGQLLSTTFDGNPFTSLSPRFDEITNWELTPVLKKDVGQFFGPRLGLAYEGRGDKAGTDPNTQYGDTPLWSLANDYDATRIEWETRTGKTADPVNIAGLPQDFGGMYGGGRPGGAGGASGGGLGLSDSEENPYGLRDPNFPSFGWGGNSLTFEQEQNIRNSQINTRWRADIQEFVPWNNNLPESNDSNNPQYWSPQYDISSGGFGGGGTVEQPDPVMGWDSALPPSKIVQTFGPDNMPMQEVHTLRTETVWNPATNSWEYYKWYQGPNEVSPAGFIPYNAERVYPPGG